MTDRLTDELERHAKLAMPGYPNDVCSRAKVEIERLTRDVDEARAEATQAHAATASWQRVADEARGEVARLQEAKRGALAMADERSKENVGLRAALKPFSDIGLAQDIDKQAPDMIEGPDLSITPAQVRAARKALAYEQRAKT